jgi:hypothetical protein
MRSRRLVAIGCGVAGLILASLTPGVAMASDNPGDVPINASKSLQSGPSGPAADPAGPAAGKCKTEFGPPYDSSLFSSEIAVYDIASAVDITCPKKKKKRTFTTLTVQGAHGNPDQTEFDVTVYADDGGPGGTRNEPDLGNVVCATQRVVGSPTGHSYPDWDTTTITLDTPCRADRGTNWVEVQGVPLETPWFWRFQTSVGGKYEADWRDVGEERFGTPCSVDPYDDEFYMRDCLFEDPSTAPPDFMLVLS